MNDQSIKADAGKIQPTLVPTALIQAVARVRKYGIDKCTAPKRAGARWSHSGIGMPCIGTCWPT